MAQFCDLHTHSVFSDGTCTPAEIIEAAVAQGLKAVALTDHDSVDGLPDFLAAAEGKPIEAVAGAEFAVIHEGTELHLLALYIPATGFAPIARLMEQVHARREQCVHDLVDSLNRSGFQLDFERIKAEASGQVTRAHVALAIENTGRMTSEEAFLTLMRPGNGHYTSPERLPFLQVLELILQVGAVPVLAHPFINMTREQLENFLPWAKEKGLIGLECIYSGFDAETSALAFEMAQRFDLLPSGGSDFHGHIRKEAPLGNGERPIPYAFAQKLKTYTE